MGRPRKKDEETQEQVEETPAQEPEVEVTPVAEAEAPAEEAPIAEEPPAAEEEQAPEPVAEEEPEPAPEAEAPAEEPVAQAEEPAAEAEEPVREEAPVAAAPAPAPEEPAKKKRLPRAQRRQRTKPRRGAGGERKPIVRLPKPEHERGRRKERRGVVVSAAMDKTIVVRVDTVKPHPVYKKIVRRSSKFHAHDEGNVAKAGDVVRIVETRPVSKTKTWRLAEVLEEAK